MNDAEAAKRFVASLRLGSNHAGPAPDSKLLARVQKLEGQLIRTYGAYQRVAGDVIRAREQLHDVQGQVQRLEQRLLESLQKGGGGCSGYRADG